jgi:hypothetical protein
LLIVQVEVENTTMCGDFREMRRLRSSKEACVALASKILEAIPFFSKHPSIIIKSKGGQHMSVLRVPELPRTLKFPIGVRDGGSISKILIEDKLELRK